jgi:hypothetical protein
MEPARGCFREASGGGIEFAWIAVSDAEFVALIRSLSIGSDADLRELLELPTDAVLTGKDTLRPVVLRGEMVRSDTPSGFRMLLQGWLEPCSRNGGRFEEKNDKKLAKSGLKLFAGKTAPKSVLSDMIERVKAARTLNTESCFAFRCPGTAQFNLNAASAWNALRRGFSPHEAGIDREVFPVVEILSAIALDVVPLARLDSALRYSPWWRPLSVCDAARAFLGHLPEPWCRERYRAPVLGSGQAKFLTFADSEEEG